MRAKKIVLQDRMELYNIVARVNSRGIAAVAASLDCDPTTLTRWLRSQGYEVTSIWKQAELEKHEMKMEIVS